MLRSRALLVLGLLVALLAVAPSASAMTFVPATLPDITTYVAANATETALGQVTFDKPTAMSHVPGAPVLTCNAKSGAVFPVGSTLVFCTATAVSIPVCFDPLVCGGGGIPMIDTGNISFTVRVVADSVAPVVSGTDIAVTSTDGSPVAVAFASPTASDSGAGLDGVVSCSHASGAAFALGSTTITCTAKDAVGNVGTGSFTVTVADGRPRDIAPPVVSAKPVKQTDAAKLAAGVALTTTCDEAATVTGVLEFKQVTKRPGKKPLTKIVKVGTGSVSCTVGTTTRLTLKLNAAGKALVKRAGTVAVTLVTTTKDASGNSKVTRRTLRI